MMFIIFSLIALHFHSQRSQNLTGLKACLYSCDLRGQQRCSRQAESCGATLSKRRMSSSSHPSCMQVPVYVQVRLRATH
jgi:hypothetical protein